MPSRSGESAGAGLDTYRAKRRASVTPEPFAAIQREATAGARRLFVVQQHAATRLHWDFRLEVDNVLRSWAVPKGPSMDPEDKRFAALVEDHPLDYADFEGHIPEGNYGAGNVIVWDQGTYVELEDFRSGFADGKLLFDLNGHKLRGRFTLIKLKGKENTGKEWLLIKERDQWARTGGISDTSVLSGLTVDSLDDAGKIQSSLTADIESLEPSPPTRRAVPAEPMLASASEPFHRDGWVFEIKYDGYRLMIERRGDDVTLRSRRGLDLTALFPEIAKCARRLPYDEYTIDSEVVVLDGRGIPSFARLQQRAARRGAAALARASMHDPVTCFAFDLVDACGYDLTDQPLLERKRLLERMLPAAGPIRYSAHVDGNGIETFHAMTRIGLEGVVGKRADSTYRSGRSPDAWRKVRARRSADFVVAGWTPTKSNSADIGALVLAEYRGGELAYCGRVGSGLGEGNRREAKTRLAELGPGDALSDDATHRWIERRHVCEVEFREYSADGHLRHPVFVRFRDDKAPKDCVSGYDEPAEVDFDPEPVREVIITNRDKIFFPEQALTKGDLIDYYENVAPWMLPYLVDRPLVLTRFPDGIHGKSFYQRDAPAFVPDWLTRKTLWSESAEREVNYFVVQNVESLKYLANMGAIPIHAWHSRITDLEHPDWCVLDLDPKDAPFAHVVDIARTIEELLAEIDLPGFLKTSGASGLHILLPLARQLTHGQARSLGELLARVVIVRRGDIATITRVVRQRENKVYVDFMQNGHGQLLVAPFSARARGGGLRLDADRVVRTRR